MTSPFRTPGHDLTSPLVRNLGTVGSAMAPLGSLSLRSITGVGLVLRGADSPLWPQTAHQVLSLLQGAEQTRSGSSEGCYLARTWGWGTGNVTLPEAWPLRLFRFGAVRDVPHHPLLKDIELAADEAATPLVMQARRLDGTDVTVVISDLALELLEISGLMTGAQISQARRGL